MKTGRDFGSVRITCGVNLKTNERLIEIAILDPKTMGTVVVVEMTPKDFAETLTSHVDRPAMVTFLKS